MFRSSSVGQRPTSSVPPGTRSQLQNGAVQRGLGALPSTSKMDASPGGGASIFGMMGPSCPACPFLWPRLPVSLAPFTPPANSSFPSNRQQAKKRKVDTFGVVRYNETTKIQMNFM